MGQTPVRQPGRGVNGWGALLAGLGVTLAMTVFAQTPPAKAPASTNQEPAPAGQEAEKPTGESVPGADEATQTPAPKPIPRTEVDPRASLLKALNQSIPEREHVLLEDPLMTGDSRQFLGLYLPNNAANVMGGVILVHDLGQHADWPQIIRPLRQQLPDYGWHTLSINLSTPPDEKIPERVLPDKKTVFEMTPADQPSSEASKAEDAGEAAADAPAEKADPSAETPVSAAETSASPAGKTEAASSGDEPMIRLDGPQKAAKDAKPKSSYAEHGVARIAAAVNDMRQRGVANLVLLGVGEGARLVALYQKEHPVEGREGRSLIWIDARISSDETHDFKLLLGERPYPRIFDVVDSSDPVSQADAIERMRSARRLRMTDYLQANVPLRSAERGLTDEMLVQRLKAWLEVNAPGEEKTSSAFPGL